MDKLAILIDALPWVTVMTVAGVGGWLLNTWLRIKNGYPLETSWGSRSIPPATARRPSGSSC